MRVIHKNKCFSPYDYLPRGGGSRKSVSMQGEDRLFDVVLFISSPLAIASPKARSKYGLRVGTMLSEERMKDETFILYPRRILTSSPKMIFYYQPKRVMFICAGLVLFKFYSW